MRHAGILALLITASCDDRPRQWDAMVYLEDGLEPHQSVRGFKSFELCQQAGEEALSRLPEAVRQNAYFDCGYQCRYEPKYGTTICKETRD